MMRKNLPLVLFLSFTATFFAQPEYKDVAPVFYSRCTACHHTGAHEYPFMNYAQTSVAAPLIQVALSTGIMPPWNADTSYTRFQHERIITAGEKQKILDWIAAGTPKGDTALAPLAPVYASEYQLIGQPDLEIGIGTFTSTSATADKYYCFSMPSGLTTDRIIRAFEVVPGNKEIVHHAVITADTLGNYQSDLSGFCYNVPGDVGIGTYAPGARATVFPSKAPLKAGIYLKAGSQIIIQLHYPEGSAGKVDSTKIRLYFYPQNETGVRRIYSETPLQNWQMFIGANSVVPHTAYYPGASALPVPYSIYGVMPHSHLLCKSIIMYAVKPNVDTIPLIRINHWDFEWQDYYFFRKLVHIPAGYRLFARHVFDNTTNNPHNPNNPPVHVVAGTDTDDEMLFDGVLRLNYETGDELIDLESIIASDPLLGVSEAEPELLDWFSIFPNPANGTLKSVFTLRTPCTPVMRLIDVAGQEVFSASLGSKPAGLHEWQRSLDDLAPGVYFARLQTCEGTRTKKIIVQ